MHSSVLDVNQVRFTRPYSVRIHGKGRRDPTPSEADIKVTRDLIRTGQVLKIEVVDHVIPGQRTLERPVDWVSLRQTGFFYS